MKILKIMAVAVMLICVVLVCVSCKDKEETPSAPEQATGRFDYFSVENYSEYVSIDSSVYENVKIELEDKFTVSDKQVDEYIEYLLFQKKTVKNNGAKITEEAIKKGDSAFIFYRGVLLGEDGNVILDENGKEKEFEGGSNMDAAAPYELSIGSGSFIDDFEDQLIGVVPKDTSPTNLKTVDVTFPENYGEASLAGKDARFYVYVSWIVQYDVPQYNEQFIKEVLKYTPTTEDVVGEHKAYIKKTLGEQFESSKSQEIESAIWDALYKGATILKYPDTEIEYFYNAYCDDLKDQMTMYNYYYNYGFSDVQVFARWYFGLDENGDWQSVVREQAKQAVTQTLIYHAVAQQCGIQLTDADFEAAVAEYIELYKTNGKEYTREEVIEMLGETTIKEGNLYEAVVKYIKDRATITYKPVEE